ncbi:hypothetical protein MASR2M74_03810 [Paracoccaceae bacterium]
MTLLTGIQDSSERLTTSDRRIIAVLLGQQGEAVFLSAAQLAERAQMTLKNAGLEAARTAEMVIAASLAQAVQDGVSENLFLNVLRDLLRVNSVPSASAYPRLVCSTAAVCAPKRPDRSTRAEPRAIHGAS